MLFAQGSSELEVLVMKDVVQNPLIFQYRILLTFRTNNGEAKINSNPTGLQNNGAPSLIHAGNPNKGGWEIRQLPRGLVTEVQVSIAK